MTVVSNAFVSENLVLATEDKPVEKALLSDLFRGRRICLMTLTMWFAWYVFNIPGGHSY